MIVVILLKKNIEDYNVFEVLNMALQIKSQVLKNYCCWYLKVNFDQYGGKSGFKQLDSNLKQEITNEQWPGSDFRLNFTIWEKKVRESREKRKKSSQSRQKLYCTVIFFLRQSNPITLVYSYK